MNIQLNIVTCPTYPHKFIRDNVVARDCNCHTASGLYLTCTHFRVPGGKSGENF